MRNKRDWQWKRLVSVANLGMMLMGMFAVNLGGSVVQAASPGAVVINEIAWAGSINSANDEWIELYNPGSLTVNLAGWKLRYNGADLYTFGSGTAVPAKEYFLIERSEAATSVPADVIVSMALANTGASLELVDGAGASIDMVNSAKAAWFFGSSTTRATMERKDPTSSGDVASNWGSSTGSGSTASAGGAIIGTPRAVNSDAVAGVATDGTIKLNLSSATPAKGDTLKVTVDATAVSDLLAYGLDITYDAAVLELVNVSEGGFLNDGGAVVTAFNSGLKGGVAGDLLVANARTIDPKVGKTGSGELFNINFKVIGNSGSSSEIKFVTAETFAASSSADLNINWQSAIATVKETTINPVTNLVSAEGIARYQIKLTWTASDSTPDHYQVERKDSHGNWVIIGGVTGLEFLDQDGVANGGKIIPQLTYQYRVSAVKGALLSLPVEISGTDVRGIKGDNNRTDLVDGRDLERLAKAFALTDAQVGFEALIDTTYDARIDGSDLIDIGANFARKF